MITEINNISNEVLSRLFFRRLWQCYDSGGVSVGRSLQSDLVEAYIALNQHEYIPDFPLGLRDFAHEAERRAFPKHKQTLLGNLENLSIISSFDISLLCVEALSIWYQIHKDEIYTQGYVANTWEGRFVNSICEIMPIPFFPHFKSDEDIIKISREANDRVRIRLMDNELSSETHFFA